MSNEFKMWCDDLDIFEIIIIHTEEIESVYFHFSTDFFCTSKFHFFTLLLPPAKKFWQGYIFTGVCDSVHRGGSGPGGSPIFRGSPIFQGVSPTFWGVSYFSGGSPIFRGGSPIFWGVSNFFFFFLSFFQFFSPKLYLLLNSCTMSPTPNTCSQ